MAIVTPSRLIPISDAEVAFNTPVSEETVRKIGQNLNVMSALVPIGTVQAFAVAQPGVSSPSPDLWQVCDGAEITNPNSPLRTIGITTNFTPNLTSKFICGAPNTTSNGTLGTATLDLTHKHVGTTGDTDGLHNAVSGSTANIRDLHHHTIDDDLGVTNLDPAHQEVLFYLKVV